MIIQQMTTADYEESYALWTQAAGVGLRSLDDSREGIGKFLQRNPHTCFITRDEETGKLTGTLLCGHDGRRAYLYHLLVHPQFRGQGIGRKLVDTVLSALKQEGIHKCALVVFADNAGGNDFWEALGFRTRKDLHYRDFTIEPANQ